MINITKAQTKQTWPRSTADTQPEESSALNTTHSAGVTITPDYSNPKLFAAGTLLYARNPDDNHTYILLSKEREWEGPSSNRWTGLGGHQDADESLVETALRETREESRGIIDYPLEKVPFNELFSIEHYRCKYLQIMLEIKYDPTISERFQKLSFDSKYYMEKTELRWINFLDLMNGVETADKKAEEDGVIPRMITTVIKSGNETLSLGKYFAETMVYLNRAAPDALKNIATNIKNSALTVSDRT